MEPRREKLSDFSSSNKKILFDLEGKLDEMGLISDDIRD